MSVHFQITLATDYTPDGIGMYIIVKRGFELPQMDLYVRHFETKERYANISRT